MQTTRGEATEAVIASVESDAENRLMVSLRGADVKACGGRVVPQFEFSLNHRNICRVIEPKSAICSRKIVAARNPPNPRVASAKTSNELRKTQIKHPAMKEIK
jgi:hypothetical protein